MNKLFFIYLNFLKISPRILFICFFAFYAFPVKAQVSKEEIKATLIVHFCENVDWAQPIKNQFIIGYYADNDLVFQILESVKNRRLYSNYWLIIKFLSKYE
jgi:hypothetical protein